VLLECWVSLTHYFTLAVTEDHLKSAEIILDMLRNQVIKSYFLFLKYSLQYFNSYNAMFQTRSIIIQDLYSNTTKLLKLLCQNFIKPSLLRDDLSKLVYDDPNNLLPESEVFLGAECEMGINNLPDSIVSEVRTQCLKFYIKAAEKISIRLQLYNKMFKEITVLDSSIALDASNRSSVKYFPVLSNIFENYINSTKLIEEWRESPYFFKKEEINNLKNMSINEMWHNIGQVNDFTSDTNKFLNISKLTKLVLTLPHSNAEAEKIFSVVNDVKTKKRNRISDDTLNVVTVIRSSFQDKNISSADFKITKSHTDLHNVTMYK